MRRGQHELWSSDPLENPTRRPSSGLYRHMHWRHPRFGLAFRPCRQQPPHAPLPYLPQDPPVLLVAAPALGLRVFCQLESLGTGPTNRLACCNRMVGLCCTERSNTRAGSTLAHQHLHLYGSHATPSTSPFYRSTLAAPSATSCLQRILHPYCSRPQASDDMLDLRLGPPPLQTGNGTVRCNQLKDRVPPGYTGQLTLWRVVVVVMVVGLWPPRLVRSKVRCDHRSHHTVPTR